METPDLWLVIKIEPDLYKVVASYYGSYLHRDHWRFNSGIVKIEDEGNHYLIHGKSGSIYKCHKNQYGCHNTTQGLLEYIAEINPIYVLSEEQFEEYYKAEH